MSSGDQGIAPERYEGVYDAIRPEKLAGSMEGKTVFITGAGRGIGKAIAIAFAQSGADVALVARTGSQLEAVATQIRSQFNRRVITLPIDVTDSAALAAGVALVEKEWGRIDILIPNAGVNTFRPFVHTPFNEWWKIMEINLKGSLELASLVLEGMRKRNEGAIVFVSSRAATVSLPGMTGYSASKTALTRFVTCLQQELDAEGFSGIHTYSIHPGAVDTDLTPGAVHPDIELMAPGFSKRMAIVVKDSIHPLPELSAWTCVYLATGKARALRGLYLDVDQNIETIIAQADTVRREDMYNLIVKFLGGLDNLGGKAGQSWANLSDEATSEQKVDTKL